MIMSAAKSVGSAALSGLGMVGNALDLIPSMARDVAVLDNPFDQFLDPLSHSATGRSASGRDVLARNILTSWLFTPNKETGMSGWMDDPLEGVQDVLGFGLEMATGGFTRAPGALIRGLRGTKPAANAAASVARSAAPAAASAAKATGPLAKIVRGAKKVGDVLNELDPGTHVGRAIDKQFGGAIDKTRRALVFGPERKRVAGMLGGVANSQEEADAVLRIAEARAMTWAKEQPGRTPDEYFKGFEDIRKSEPGDVGADALQQPAFHGTPNTWEPEPGFPQGRPRLDKMGTGEGTQVYGWGWYSAGNEKVAQSYRNLAFKELNKKISDDLEDYDALYDFATSLDKQSHNLKPEEVEFIKALANNDALGFGNPTAAITEIARNPNWVTEFDPGDDLVEAAGKMGALLKLDIPDDDFAKLMDFDQPLNAQPQVMQAINGPVKQWFMDNGKENEFAELMKGTVKVEGGEYVFVPISHMTGSQFYRNLSSKAGGGNKLASEILAQAGIPGNKYFDRMSRNASAAERTRNHVIWDQSVLDRTAVLEKNGQKIAAAKQAANTLFQDPSAYRAEPFYSKIMEAVDAGKIPNKVGREQLLKTLTGYGVKQEELTDMQKELDALFAAAPDGKVSKDDVFDLAAEKSIGGELEITELSNSRVDELRRAQEVANAQLNWPEVNRIERDIDAELANKKSTQYQGYQVSGGIPGTYREVLLRHPSAKGFKSHFNNYDDVIAHIRLDDVELPNGKKALRIQEIQSDLHQEGAKKGYDSPDVVNNRTKEIAIEDTFNELANILGNENLYNPIGNFGYANLDDYKTLLEVEIGPADAADAWHEITQKIANAKPEVEIPNAVFKKSWHELALKTVVRKAAEEGYDTVALVRGKDIAHVVGGPPDALGKFYDEKLNNTLKKLVKKHGGKVEESSTKGGRLQWVERNDAYGRLSEVAEAENGMTAYISSTEDGYQLIVRDAQGKVVSSAFDSRSGNLYNKAEAMLPTRKDITTFELPPALRNEVLTKGQPLYQKPSATTGPKGAIEFLDDNRAVIHAFKSADISTLAHELGHKFRRDIPARLLGEAADAIGGIDDINNWPREAEEAFASSFERYLRDGSAPTTTLAKVFEKFKEWMTNIYQSIIGTPLEESVNPQLRAVFDQMLGGQPRVAGTGTPVTRSGDAVADALAALDPSASPAPQTPPPASMSPSAAANQIDDPILQLAGEAAPLSPATTVRGKLDRVGDFLSEMDPGTHVGRVVEKTIGDLSSKLSLPQIYEQQVTQRFLKTRFGQAWAERSAQKKAATAARPLFKRSPKDDSGGKYFENMTAQQELQYLVSSGTAARGSRIITDLTPEQDLATRLGSAFGGEVLFFGGSNARSKANGVRVHDTGSRLWVSADAAPSAYNNIVGHELMHLLRDTSTQAFDDAVRILQAHAPDDELAKQTKKYMDDYRAVMGKELRQGVQLEEGVARTVQAAFDRPAFWEDLVANPSVAAPVKAAFQQTMDKLKASGRLTLQEFEVMDREISAFIFGQADTMAAGATADTLAAAQRARYSSAQIEPFANLLATPGSRPHRYIQTVEDLATRINTGIQAAMNYKVGGHTYPVVQAFSRNKTNLYESMLSDVSLPAMSAVETVHRLVDSLPEADAILALSKHEEDLVRAIEKGDYANLAPELHPAARQMELAQKALFERELRSGVKVEKLSDTYVQYFSHALHPEIREKLAEIDSASPLRAPADLAATHKASQSRRTDLFREAWNGRATWNVATADPDVIGTLKNTALGAAPEIRVEAAADVLRAKYLADIDPRIPVQRDGNYTLVMRETQRNQLDAMDQPVEISMSPGQLAKADRVPSQHDLTTEAGRIAEHTNEPIVYALKSVDADGKEVITEYELLTARLPGDTRYGDPQAKLPDGTPDRHAMGLYRTASEGHDRHRVLAGWMGDIGTDTLEKTAGVFSGSALRNWQDSMRSKVNTLAVAESFPQLLSGAIRAGKLAAATGDAVKTGKNLTLKSLFDSSYYNILERQKIYLKAATLDPGLQSIATNTSARKFTQIMDDMVLDKDIMDDLKLAGTYTQRLPAIENILKPAQSAGSLWKAGVLTHPGRYVRDMTSGIFKLIYSNLFSNSAADAARRVTFSEPVEELLHYSAVKNYLDRFEMEHTAENATRAVRTMFGNFMQQSGGSIYRDYTDATKPMESAARGLESMAEAFPGDGRTGVIDMIKGAGRTAIGREGDTTFNPFDIAGVQHVFPKKDAAGKVIAEAGDIRTDTRFAPVVAGDIIGKHANDSVRMAGFLEGLRRGQAPLDAWKAVTSNQLDYNPRTFGPLESKVLKKIFPFYSFMSRETAWLAHELMTNPTGRLGKLIQLARHSQPTNEFLPEHITQGLAVPLREGEDGTENYVTGLGLMFEGPVNLLGEIGSGDMQGLSRSLLSMSSPIIKGPAEYGLGRSSFQGGPLGGRDIADLDPVGGRILTQLGLQKEKPGGQAAPAFDSPGLEFLLSNSPVSRILSSTKTALDDRKNVIERAANILTGMRITSVSPEQKQRGIRELTNAISKDLGARPFTTFHISDELLEYAKENDPEKYATLLRIKEMRKEWDKQQRIKRKERAAAEAQ